MVVTFNLNMAVKSELVGPEGEITHISFDGKTVPEEVLSHLGIAPGGIVGVEVDMDTPLNKVKVNPGKVYRVSVKNRLVVIHHQ